MAIRLGDGAQDCAPLTIESDPGQCHEKQYW